MVIENATAPFVGMGIESFAETIRPYFVKLSVMIGGLFGVYVILLLARVHYERKKVKLLNDIRYDLDRLNMHYGLRYSGSRPTLWRLFVRLVRRIFSRRRVTDIVEKTRKKNK